MMYYAGQVLGDGCDLASYKRRCLALIHLLLPEGNRILLAQEVEGGQSGALEARRTAGRPDAQKSDGH